MPINLSYLVPVSIPDDAVEVHKEYGTGNPVYMIDPVRLAGSADEAVIAVHTILMRSTSYANAWRRGLKFVLDPNRMVST